MPTSTQFLFLQNTEAPQLQAQPVMGAPFKMAMSSDAQSTRDRDGNWKVLGTVVASRPGEDPQNFRWEFTLTPKEGAQKWQILQVRQP